MSVSINATHVSCCEWIAYAKSTETFPKRFLLIMNLKVFKKYWPAKIDKYWLEVSTLMCFY